GVWWDFEVWGGWGALGAFRGVLGTPLTPPFPPPRSLEQELGFDFGSEGEFSYLYNQCYELSTSEYVYRLCPFHRVTQRPKNGGSETNLGTWGSWAGPEGDKFSAHKYEQGMGCWQGPNRGHHGEVDVWHGHGAGGGHGAESLRVPAGAGDPRGLQGAPRPPRRARRAVTPETPPGPPEYTPSQKQPKKPSENPPKLPPEPTGSPPRLKLGGGVLPQFPSPQNLKRPSQDP
ncbi:glucosidase 2 subunit beta, partial [Pseudopipra pipra]|uniref:glucosidase 2 subunit beta n=1 Tax=Pseudopipra pipra TaxID=415032 RepID=UPI0031399550